MGWLADLFREIPLSVIQQEKIAQAEAKQAAIEAEKASLKDDLREAHAEIAKLKKQIEQFSHRDLTGLDVNILQTIAMRGNGDAGIVAQDLGVHFQKAQLQLNTLEKAGYIRGVHDEYGDYLYYLCDRARRYLDENDLLPPPATQQHS